MDGYDEDMMLGSHNEYVVLDWAQQFLYHVLVAYSVFFVLGIKSIRSLGCLLYSLYFLREDLVH